MFGTAQEKYSVAINSRPNIWLAYYVNVTLFTTAQSPLDCSNVNQSLCRLIEMFYREKYACLVRCRVICIITWSKMSLSEWTTQYAKFHQACKPPCLNPRDLDAIIEMNVKSLILLNGDRSTSVSLSFSMKANINSKR